MGGESAKRPDRLWETLRPPTAPVFKDVTRFIFAGINPTKLDLASTWLSRFVGCWGEHKLELVPFKRPCEEPSWHNAGLVSKSKALSQVEVLRGKPGGETCVLATDIVVFINGKPYQNLSRQGSLDRPQLDAEIRNLQTVFANESLVRWDVALTLSKRKLLATVGVSHLFNFSAIPASLIKDKFWEDIKGAQEKATRIPLVEMYDFVNYAGVIPYSMVCSSSGRFYEEGSWVDNITWTNMPGEDYLDSVSYQVRSGIPLSGKLNRLLEVTPSLHREREIWW